MAAALLSLGLPESVVERVVRVDDELVLAARLERAGVEGEVRVATLVRAEDSAVQRDGRAPVDGAEAQEGVLVPLARHAERAAVACMFGVEQFGRTDVEWQPELAPRLRQRVVQHGPSTTGLPFRQSSRLIHSWRFVCAGFHAW